jgi:hypothetical protein
VAYLTAAGIFFRRMQSGKVRVKRGFMQLGPEGTADFLICPAQREPVWIELKAPKGTTKKSRKEAQALFAEGVRSLGHTYAICESLDDVKAVLAGVTVREV